MDKDSYQKKLWDLAVLQNMIQDQIDNFLDGETDIIWFSAAIGAVEYQKQSLVSQLAGMMEEQ